MAALISTGLANAMLGGSSLKSALEDGFIDVYACSLVNIPVSADDAIDPAKHTKLLRVYGDGVSAGLNMGTADNKTIGKAAGETWAGTVLATGTATFFRYVNASDDGAAGAAKVRMQGRCGQSGAELNLSSLNLVSGATQAINFVSVGW